MSRIFYSALLAGLFLPALSFAQPFDRGDLTERENERRMAELLPNFRTSLQGDSVDAQRATLTLLLQMVPDMSDTSDRSSFDATYNIRNNISPHLVTFLKRRTSDPVAIALAIKALGQCLPAADDVKQLFTPLASSPHSEIRQAISVASGSLVNNAAVLLNDSVMRLNPLRGRDPNYFANVTNVVLPFLGTALEDSDSKARVAAADAFRTVARVFTQFSRITTQFSLSELLPAEKVEEKRKAIEPLFKIIGEQMVHFTSLLRSSDRRVALSALEKLAVLRRSLSDNPNSLAMAQPLDEAFRKLSPLLLELRHEADPQIRLALVESVEPLDRKLIPKNLLLDSSKDPNLFVRWASVRALGMHAPREMDDDIPSEIATLAHVLRDTDVDVRISASSALARYGSLGKPASSELANMAKKGDVEPRVSAIRTLNLVKADAEIAVPAMILALEHDDVRLQRAAAIALKDYGPAAKEALLGLRKALKVDDPELRTAAAAAIFAIELPPPPKKPREI